MLIKICGMKECANIEAIAQLNPDWMGFIFYPKSKRYVGENYPLKLIQSVMPKIQTVGVFVNEDIDKVLETAEKFRFNFIQLHGNESPTYCQEVKNEGFKVIKAFGIFPDFQWDTLNSYHTVCDYFLFDTSTMDYGGSGQKFDWKILSGYTIDKPFLLSGGLKPEDAALVLSLKHKQFAGIDINSGFEIEPGIKDPQKVQYFFNELNKTKISI